MEIAGKASDVCAFGDFHWCISKRHALCHHALVALVNVVDKQREMGNSDPIRR
jgi:hypothetical protein